MSIAEYDTANTTDYAAQLRQMCVGCKMSRKRWGIKKTLDKSQKKTAASAFDADGSLLSASKTLIDPSDADYKIVSALFSQVAEEWRKRTLPFPDEGIRLLRREHVEDWEEVVARFQRDIDRAVDQMQSRYWELIETARGRLGSLFVMSDYPASFEGLFVISTEYPSISVDPSLVAVSSALYHREQQRIAARFDEAVQLAEAAFAEEFQGLLQHLVERLQGLEDGTAKRFHDSNVTNLQDFFERFRQLNIGNNEQLNKLVDDARGVVEGIDPAWVREHDGLRKSIKTKIADIDKAVCDLMVNRPSRAISFDD